MAKGDTKTSKKESEEETPSGVVVGGIDGIRSLQYFAIMFVAVFIIWLILVGVGVIRF